MRPIDADVLLAVARDMQSETEETAYNFLNDAQNPSTEWECVEDLIENAPTLDCVPVVRCKDCLFSQIKHYLGDTDLYCKRFHKFKLESDFCSRGKRKGGEQNATD